MADKVVQVQPGKLEEKLDPDEYSAIVIMSHHLETDGKYLHELADYSPDYIGLLFSEFTGNIVLGGCCVWMITGVIVMRNMIRFDF